MFQRRLAAVGMWMSRSVGFCTQLTAITIIVLIILENQIWTDEAQKLIDLRADNGSPNSSQTDPLHPPGLQVLDLKDFIFHINSDICGNEYVSVMTIISSALPNKVIMFINVTVRMSIFGVQNFLLQCMF